MSLFEEFLSLPWVNNWSTHRCAKDAYVECVIVEPRSHPLLERVLRNVSCIFPRLAMTIVHSKENESFIRSFLPDDGSHHVQMICKFEGNIDVPEYNRLFTNLNFWTTDLKSPYVLVFQTDVGICRNEILKFLKYDYIGAPWNWQVGPDARVFNGNGGFSLRKRNTMIEILSRAPFEQWGDPWGDQDKNGMPEDVFFSRRVWNMDSVKLPSKATCTEFSVEHFLGERPPMGFHQAHIRLPPSALKKFEEWTCEAMCDVRGLKVSDSSIFTITDVILEVPSMGISIDMPQLVSFFEAGIVSGGLLIPEGTHVPYDEDPCPCEQKQIKVLTSQREYIIPLCRHRVIETTILV